MAVEVIVLDRFAEWLDALSIKDQKRVMALVDLLEEYGTTLPYPHSSRIRGTRVHDLRELRAEIRAKPIRILYGFDTLRQAVVILGGDKGGDDRWYEKHVPEAERLMTEYLRDTDQL